MREGMPASASIKYVIAVIEYLEQHGRDPVSLFGPELMSKIIRHESARVSVEQWKAILQTACRCLNDPAFPLKLAATIKPRHLGILGYLLMSCDTLASAAFTLQQYERLVDDVNEVKFNVDGRNANAAWIPTMPNPPVEFIMLSMSLWAHYARWLTETPELVCDAKFSFPKPSEQKVASCFDNIFGGRVDFEQDINSLSFPVRYLKLQIAQRDSHVHQSLKKRADLDLRQTASRSNEFVAQLEVVIADNLESGDISLVDMAKAMKISPRTLQNRLELLGVTYRQVLDRVRMRQAQLHLSDPAMSLLDVTVLLGFTQQSAFQHAFKRWTGASPGSYRRRFA